ncbi:uncharacterized protein LOC113295636 [Papaver somniferum]|uniref:uncharacterized protein LOC113295636 n=1 Tax=Papaver somniferum TaxID=3469 RepID=UPI000E705503|nr:uncharacterized protein LOC113295636 [Papaver somniferum]
MSAKVLKAKKEMQNVQKQVRDSPLCPQLARNERVVVQKYVTLVKYEESMLKQKSRVQWLDLGDSNSSFFFNSVKERRSRNNILTLTSSSGEVLDEDEPIARECINFYSELFDEHDTKTSKSDIIDNLNFSSLVNPSAAADLIKEVTRDEIFIALSSIGSNKAPGHDGFSSHFFKHCLSIVGDDFVAAIQNFFAKSRMLKEANSTFLTLVVKCDNPSRVTDYRPISCCNVIYKCIAKIISIRMKRILQDLISANQSAFVSGRAIQDNILVDHEIVRNYHRISGTPRCSLKIDLKKAYDTVSWKTVIDTMKKMGFYDQFLQWIFLCMSTAKYYILMNGSPHGFFDASRGLRQGNLEAATVLKTCLDDFSSCSVLQVNNQKTDLHAYATDSSLLSDITACLNCTSSELPVRYLGLPLLSTRLSYDDCLPLISKVRARIKSWKAKHLAFPGRVRLIKAVLTDMSGSDLGKKHNPIGWSTICLPLEEGGLGIKDLAASNIACNLRHIWDLVTNKSSIWTKWVKDNLIKHKNFWEMKTPQDSSWCWRRVIEHRPIVRKLLGSVIGDGTNTLFLQDNWHPKDLVIWKPSTSGQFTTKDTYKAISPHGDPIFWHSIVWFKLHIPRHSFIARVALHGRLKTRDKLVRWGISENYNCVLCDNGRESEAHLFHECPFSALIWSGLLLKMGYNRGPSTSWEVSLLIVNDIHLKLSAHPRSISDTPDNRRFLQNWNVECTFTVKIWKQCSWMGPEEDEVMINTDGSLKETTAGFGFVLRDHKGDVIDCAVGGCEPMFVVVHELQGVELGLNLVVLNQLPKVHVCVDSMTIFLLLNKSEPKPPRNLIHMWRRFCALLGNFKESELVTALEKLIVLLIGYLSYVSDAIWFDCRLDSIALSSVSFCLRGVVAKFTGGS